MSSALAAMYRIAKDLEIRTSHGESTVQAARAAAEDPGTADSSLEDLRELPFVTIDYDSSWDLDQALYIRERDRGYELFYALADAAHFVRPGDPLFAESMERGVSFYLPGLTLPMLPACLSEGTTSLLPHEDRRALTFCIRLDELGMVESTELLPSVIRSRDKLTYSGVQHFLDRPDESPIASCEYRRSLELMAVIGTLRMQLAERRDVVR
ncbi:MAG: RNB domain-containing ribonuclease, partial [Deltaproteobacteria bacterium]|nr:RNB domain-containing ribonuclease [Deltaproteobacteria bacterium]